MGSEKHHMVYKGEGISLILGMELIREEEVANRMVSIGIDNVAAISVTHEIRPCPSHYIWDILHQRVNMVYNKHKGLDLLVKWTPGHVGIRGNEKVDEEAKKAARDGLCPTHKLPALIRKELPRSKSAARQEFLWKLNLAVQEIWNSSPIFEKMAQLDPNLKHNTFAKLTNKLH